MDSHSSRNWTLPFLQSSRVLDREKARPLEGRWALIVLNQPFSRELFDLLWYACEFLASFCTARLIFVPKASGVYLPMEALIVYSTY
jgi:hypothetical protein